MAATIASSGAAGFVGAKLAGVDRRPTKLSQPIDFSSEWLSPVSFGGEEDSFNCDEDLFNEDEITFNGEVATYSLIAAAPSDGAFSSGSAFAETENKTLMEVAAETQPQEPRRAMTIPQIARSVANTVVEIMTETNVTTRNNRQSIRTGAGSGVIISAEGHILTCNHVIENVSKIIVRLNNGTVFEAKLVGRDSKTDLAVIKIQASTLQKATFGNSGMLEVGELAVAIGNPLGELGGTVTEGIISALNRDITIDSVSMNLLQTSAAVNPGNSGGGLFNQYGELIGIVNAKFRGTDIEGIGFAIPSNMAKSISDQIIKTGFVEGDVGLGLSLIEITDPFQALYYNLSALGVYVTKDDEETQCKNGDRIKSIDGVLVYTLADVEKSYENKKVGDRLRLVIVRRTNEYSTTVTLKRGGRL